MSAHGIALAAILALGAAGAGAADPPLAPAGAPLVGPELDARANELGALLRCPVCQGLSVADSPSTMARNMRLEVREKLAAGYDREQILASFERSYGEFVRLRPPLRGANWLVWVGPAILLLSGGALVFRTVRSSRRPAPSGSPGPGDPATDGLPADPRLADAIRRVRALARGVPETVLPKARPPR